MARQLRSARLAKCGTTCRPHNQPGWPRRRHQRDQALACRDPPADADGVGGCGKTRLALEVARTVVEHYTDGVWLVELGPLVDPSLVPQRVAVALEVREKAKEPLTTALANALRLRNVLLVMDNCEHLLDACALLVDDLLKACPGLSVLATSREPIGIGGEMAWRVPSRVVPEADSDATLEQLLSGPAVQLFVQRAIAAQPRFALTPRNASAVVQICRRLTAFHWRWSSRRRESRR